MSKLFFDSNRRDFSGIDKWDVSNVKDMSQMFKGAKKRNLHESHSGRKTLKNF